MSGGAFGMVRDFLAARCYISGQTLTRLTQWVITASTGTGGDVAALVQIAKGNSIKHLGNYHMPFQITVQLP
jgi:hypothetical protein